MIDFESYKNLIRDKYASVSTVQAIVFVVCFCLVAVCIVLYPLQTVMIGAPVIGLIAVWAIESLREYRLISIGAVVTLLFVWILWFYEPLAAVCLCVGMIFFAIGAFVPRASRYARIIFIACMVIIAYRPASIYLFPYSADVTATNPEDKGERLYIYVKDHSDGSDRVFEIEPEIWMLRFDPNPMWGSFEGGQSYRITYYGRKWTFLWWDIYPKVISVKKIRN